MRDDILEGPRVTVAVTPKAAALVTALRAAAHTIRGSATGRRMIIASNELEDAALNNRGQPKHALRLQAAQLRAEASLRGFREMRGTGL